MHLGPTQTAILRTLCHGGWFVCTRPSQYRSCLKLNMHRLLQRDPKNSHRFTITERGRAEILAHDAERDFRRGAA